MMYLLGAISFRGCAVVVEVLQQDLPQFVRIPAPNTVQSWVLRIGLHELTRPKEHADDWVVMVDHPCQLGNQRCLIILGIRLSHWKTLKRPLEFQDMTMVTTEVVPSSDGDQVKQQLLEVQGKIGKLAGVVSDQGSDLVKGLKLLVEEQRLEEPEQAPTRVFKDFSHASSHIFKERLLADPLWKAFLRGCGKTQPKVKQTPLGALAPPTQKAKGRYMNIGEMIRWGEKMLERLDARKGKLPAEITREALEQKFGWIRQFRRSLARAV